MYESLQQEREILLTRLRSRIETLYWVSSVTICVTTFITFWLTLGPGPGLLALTLSAILCFFAFLAKWIILDIVPDLFRLRALADAQQIKHEPARNYPSERILPLDEENPLDRNYYPQMSVQ